MVQYLRREAIPAERFWDNLKDDAEVCEADHLEPARKILARYNGIWRS
jgi:hypothetical protein